MAMLSYVKSHTCHMKHVLISQLHLISAVLFVRAQTSINWVAVGLREVKLTQTKIKNSISQHCAANNISRHYSLSLVKGRVKVKFDL
jgi:hypothetical protein